MAHPLTSDTPPILVVQVPDQGSNPLILPGEEGDLCGDAPMQPYTYTPADNPNTAASSAQFTGADIVYDVDQHFPQPDIQPIPCESDDDIQILEPETQSHGQQMPQYLTQPESLDTPPLVPDPTSVSAHDQHMVPPQDQYVSGNIDFSAGYTEPGATYPVAAQPGLDAHLTGSVPDHTTLVADYDGSVPNQAVPIADHQIPIHAAPIINPTGLVSDYTGPVADPAGQMAEYTHSVPDQTADYAAPVPDPAGLAPDYVVPAGQIADYAVPDQVGQIVDDTAPTGDYPGSVPNHTEADHPHPQYSYSTDPASQPLSVSIPADSGLEHLDSAPRLDYEQDQAVPEQTSVIEDDLAFTGLQFTSASGPSADVGPAEPATGIFKSWLMHAFGGQSVVDVLPTLANISGRREQLKQEPAAAPEGAPTEAPAGEGQPRKVEDAISYVNEIKATYKAVPRTFNRFLCLLRDFKLNKISLDNIMREIKQLFVDNPHLIKGFDQFLPANKRAPPPKKEDPELEGDTVTPADMFCLMFYGHKSPALPLLQPRVQPVIEYGYPDVEMASDKYASRSRSVWLDDLDLNKSESELEDYESEYPVKRPRGRPPGIKRSDDSDESRRPLSQPFMNRDKFHTNGRGRSRGRGRGRGQPSNSFTRAMFAKKGLYQSPRRGRGRPPKVHVPSSSDSNSDSGEETEVDYDSDEHPQGERNGISVERDKEEASTPGEEEEDIEVEEEEEESPLQENNKEESMQEEEETETSAVPFLAKGPQSESQTGGLNTDTKDDSPDTILDDSPVTVQDHSPVTIQDSPAPVQDSPEYSPAVTTDAYSEEDMPQLSPQCKQEPNSPTPDQQVPIIDMHRGHEAQGNKLSEPLRRMCADRVQVVRQASTNGDLTSRAVVRLRRMDKDFINGGYKAFIAAKPYDKTKTRSTTLTISANLRDRVLGRIGVKGQKPIDQSPGRSADKSAMSDTVLNHAPETAKVGEKSLKAEEALPSMEGAGDKTKPVEKDTEKCSALSSKIARKDFRIDLSQRNKILKALENRKAEVHGGGSNMKDKSSNKCTTIESSQSHPKSSISTEHKEKGSNDISKLQSPSSRRKSGSFLEQQSDKMEERDSDITSKLQSPTPHQTSSKSTEQPKDKIKERDANKTSKPTSPNPQQTSGKSTEQLKDKMKEKDASKTSKPTSPNPQQTSKNSSEQQRDKMKEKNHDKISKLQSPNAHQTSSKSTEQLRDKIKKKYSVRMGRGVVVPPNIKKKYSDKTSKVQSSNRHQTSDKSTEQLKDEMKEKNADKTSKVQSLNGHQTSDKSTEQLKDEMKEKIADKTSKVQSPNGHQTSGKSAEPPIKPESPVKPMSAFQSQFLNFVSVPQGTESEFAENEDSEEEVFDRQKNIDIKLKTPTPRADNARLRRKKNKKDRKRRKQENVVIHQTLTSQVPYVQLLDYRKHKTNLVSLEDVVLEDFHVKVLHPDKIYVSSKNKPDTKPDTDAVVYRCTGIVREINGMDDVSSDVSSSVTEDELPPPKVITKLMDDAMRGRFNTDTRSKPYINSGTKCNGKAEKSADKPPVRSPYRSAARAIVKEKAIGSISGKGDKSYVQSPRKSADKSAKSDNVLDTAAKKEEKSLKAKEAHTTEGTSDKTTPEKTGSDTAHTDKRPTVSGKILKKDLRIGLGQKNRILKAISPHHKPTHRRGAFETALSHAQEFAQEAKKAIKTKEAHGLEGTSGKTKPADTVQSEKGLNISSVVAKKALRTENNQSTSDKSKPAEKDRAEKDLNICSKIVKKDSRVENSKSTSNRTNPAEKDRAEKDLNTCTKIVKKDSRVETSKSISNKPNPAEKVRAEKDLNTASKIVKKDSRVENNQSISDKPKPVEADQGKIQGEKAPTLSSKIVKADLRIDLSQRNKILEAMKKRKAEVKLVNHLSPTGKSPDPKIKRGNEKQPDENNSEGSAKLISTPEVEPLDDGNDSSEESSEEDEPTPNESDYFVDEDSEDGSDDDDDDEFYSRSHSRSNRGRSKSKVNHVVYRQGSGSSSANERRTSGDSQKDEPEGTPSGNTADPGTVGVSENKTDSGHDKIISGDTSDNSFANQGVMPGMNKPVSEQRTLGDDTITVEAREGKTGCDQELIIYGGTSEELLAYLDALPEPLSEQRTSGDEAKVTLTGNYADHEVVRTDCDPDNRIYGGTSEIPLATLGILPEMGALISEQRPSGESHTSEPDTMSEVVRTDSYQENIIETSDNPLANLSAMPELHKLVSYEDDEEICIEMVYEESEGGVSGSGMVSSSGGVEVEEQEEVYDMDPDTGQLILQQRTVTRTSSAPSASYSQSYSPSDPPSYSPSYSPSYPRVTQTLTDATASYIDPTLWSESASVTAPPVDPIPYTVSDGASVALSDSIPYTGSFKVLSDIDTNLPTTATVQPTLPAPAPPSTEQLTTDVTAQQVYGLYSIFDPTMINPSGGQQEELAEVCESFQLPKDLLQCVDPHQNSPTMVDQNHNQYSVVDAMSASTELCDVMTAVHVPGVEPL